ncbi:MAG: energy-dependent translational throttle protein EttA [Planctomycetota bacterium]|jgi:ATP-binding cassette ChvD family protein
MSADEYVLQLGRVSRTFDGRHVLEDISLAFLRGARIGVIGHNGSGKSTLLRILAGEDPDFDGVRRAADDLRIGYLPQEPVLSPGTVQDNLDEAVADTRALLARYDALNEKLGEDLSADAMQEALEALEKAQTEIEVRDAWELDHQLAQASHALGLPEADADVERCSGGERRRVALCKILLQHPDVLLLDEPTNHLDADAVQWLERHLADYEGTVIAITHDRYFLDNVAQWMLEMVRGKGIPYKGNYSAYLEQRAAKEAVEERQEKARQKLLERELEWIRQSPRARTAKSKARIKNFEQLYDRQRERRDETISITIPAGEKLGDLVLRLEGLTKSFGDRTVIDGLSLELPPGSILGVIGPNGTGKTTLLKLIAGQMEPDGGSVLLGPTVHPCYVDQDRADLDPKRTVWEEISDGAQELKLGNRTMNSRAYVSRFNFRGVDQQQPVGTLSGGQRNRVQLAKMLRRGGNLLLVDEPTNDLDLGTIRVLEDAIAAFPGCAVVVSHDRFFLDRIATHILAFEPGGRARFWEGNYATYRERLAEEREAAGLGPEKRGTHRRLR